MTFLVFFFLVNPEIHAQTELSTSDGIAQCPNVIEGAILGSSSSSSLDYEIQCLSTDNLDAELRSVTIVHCDSNEIASISFDYYKNGAALTSTEQVLTEVSSCTAQETYVTSFYNSGTPTITGPDLCADYGQTCECYGTAYFIASYPDDLIASEVSEYISITCDETSFGYSGSAPEAQCFCPSSYYIPKYISYFYDSTSLMALQFWVDNNSEFGLNLIAPQSLTYEVQRGGLQNVGYVYYNEFQTGGETYPESLSEDDFNTFFQQSRDHIIYWSCTDYWLCLYGQSFYYKRLTDTLTFEPYKYFYCQWTEENNVRGVDYEIYDSESDALAGTNPSTQINMSSCSYFDSIGFPGTCLGGSIYTSIQAEGCLEPSDEVTTYYGTGVSSFFIYVLHYYMTTNMDSMSYGGDYQRINGDIQGFKAEMSSGSVKKLTLLQTGEAEGQECVIRTTDLPSSCYVNPAQDGSVCRSSGTFQASDFIDTYSSNQIVGYYEANETTFNYLTFAECDGTFFEYTANSVISIDETLTEFTITTPDSQDLSLISTTSYSSSSITIEIWSTSFKSQRTYALCASVDSTISLGCSDLLNCFLRAEFLGCDYFDSDYSCCLYDGVTQVHQETSSSSNTVYYVGNKDYYFGDRTFYTSSSSVSVSFSYCASDYFEWDYATTTSSTTDNSGNYVIYVDPSASTFEQGLISIPKGLTGGYSDSICLGYDIQTLIINNGPSFATEALNGDNWEVTLAPTSLSDQGTHSVQLSYYYFSDLSTSYSQSFLVMCPAEFEEIIFVTLADTMHTGTLHENPYTTALTSEWDGCDIPTSVSLTSDSSYSWLTINSDSVQLNPSHADYGEFTVTFTQAKELYTSKSQEVTIIFEVDCPVGVWYEDPVATFPTTIQYGDAATQYVSWKTIMSDNTANAVDWSTECLEDDFLTDITLIDAPDFMSVETGDDGEFSVVFDITQMSDIGDNQTYTVRKHKEGQMTDKPIETQYTVNIDMDCSTKTYIPPVLETGIAPTLNEGVTTDLDPAQTCQLTDSGAYLTGTICYFKVPFILELDPDDISWSNCVKCEDSLNGPIVTTSTTKSYASVVYWETVSLVESTTHDDTQYGTVDFSVRTQVTYVKIEPTTVAHCLTDTLQINQTLSPHTTQTSFSINVEPDCPSFEFQPWTIEDQSLNMLEQQNLDLITSLVLDSDSVSWSQICGEANIVILEVKSDLEVEPTIEDPFAIASNQIQLESTTLDQMGDHVYRLRRTTTSDYGQVTDDYDFNVEFYCKVTSFTTSRSPGYYQEIIPETFVVYESEPIYIPIPEFVQYPPCEEELLITTIINEVEIEESEWIEVVYLDAGPAIVLNPKEDQVGTIKVGFLITTESYDETIDSFYTLVEIEVQDPCGSRQWLDISEAPEVAYIGRSDAVFEVPTTMENGYKDIHTSWSEVCGEALITLENNTASFVSLNDNVVSILPSKTSHVGSFTFDIRQAGSEETTDRVQTITFYVDAQCDKKTVDQIEGNKSKTINVGDELIFWVPTSLSADEDGNSWSEICTDGVVVRVTGQPSFVNYDSGFLEIKPQTFQDEGFYSFRVYQGAYSTRFYITVECLVQDLVLEENYLVGQKKDFWPGDSEPIELNYPNFTQYPNCNKKYKYKTLINDSISNASWLGKNDSQKTLTLNPAYGVFGWQKIAFQVLIVGQETLKTDFDGTTIISLKLPDEEDHDYALSEDIEFTTEEPEIYERRITTYGYIELGFTQIMRVPSYYRKPDENVFSVDLISKFEGKDVVQEASNSKAQKSKRQLKEDLLVMQTEEYEFSWEIFNVTAEGMGIQLTFASPDVVSTSVRKPERMRISMEAENWLTSLQSQKPIAKGFSLEVDLPPQIQTKEQAELLEAMEEVTQAVLGVNLILLLLFQLVLGKVIKLMWPLFFTTQLLIYQILYKDTLLPANVLNFFISIKGAIELDALPKKEIQEAILPGEKGREIFESGGLLLIILPACFGLVLILLLCLCIVKKCGACCKKILLKIKDTFIFNGVINSIRVGYLPIVIGSGVGRWINREPLEITVNKPILIYIWVPVFLCLVFVYKHDVVSLKRPEIIKQYSNLFVELRQRDFDAMLYWVFFLIRRIFFAASLNLSIFSLKIYCAFFMQVLVIWYMFKVQPFQESSMNSIYIINEVLLCFYFYLIPLYTLLVAETEDRYQFGYYTIGVMYLMFAVNFLYMFGKIILQIKHKRALNKQIAEKQAAIDKYKEFLRLMEPAQKVEKTKTTWKKNLVRKDKQDKSLKPVLISNKQVQKRMTVDSAFDRKIQIFFEQTWTKYLNDVRQATAPWQTALLSRNLPLANAAFEPALYRTVVTNENDQQVMGRHERYRNFLFQSNNFIRLAAYDFEVRLVEMKFDQVVTWQVLRQLVLKDYQFGPTVHSLNQYQNNNGDMRSAMNWIIS